MNNLAIVIQNSMSRHLSSTSDRFWKDDLYYRLGSIHVVTYMLFIYVVCIHVPLYNVKQVTSQVIQIVYSP